VRLGFTDQRCDRWIARETSIPIRFAIDLYCLKHRRQTGGGQEYVSRDFRIAKDVPAAGSYIGCRYEKLDRRSAEPGKVNAFSENIAQRIESVWIEIVWREYSAHQVHRDKDGGPIERPAACHAVK